MICSLNEVGGLARKAAVGAGYPAGLAQSVAAAAVWLCALGRDGLGAVLDAVEDGYTPAVACSPSPYEMIAAGDIREAIVDSPRSALLLVGLAGITGRATGSCFALSNDDGTTVRVDGTGFSGSAPEQLAHASRIVVTTSPAIAHSSSGTPHGVDIDESTWAALQVLAQRTYVPATDESRLRGAGAGLTDND